MSNSNLKETNELVTAATKTIAVGVDKFSDGVQIADAAAFLTWVKQ